MVDASRASNPDVRFAHADAVAFDCTGQRIVEDTTLDSMALIARKPGAQRKAVPGE